MSNCPLCNRDAAEECGPPLASDGKRPSSLLRRAWRSVQWIFPATVLVLIPKCPMCVAAYVALFTGIGISISTARWIEILMLAVCLASLAYLAIGLPLSGRHLGRPESDAAGHSSSAASKIGA